MNKIYYMLLFVMISGSLPLNAQIATYKKDGTDSIRVSRIYFNGDGTGKYSIGESRTTYDATNEVSLYDSTSIIKPHLKFEDEKFLLCLVKNYDLDGDGGISKDEASAITGVLDVKGNDIKSLAGIKYLVNITGLNCSSNKIDTLDLSANTKLQTAYVGNQSDANGANTVIVIKRGTLDKNVFPDLNVKGKANYMVKFVIDSGMDPGINSWSDDGRDDGGSAN